MPDTNRIGTAGFEKPQDCVVTVQLKDGGGIVIHLHSKWEHMFGRRIIQSAEETLKELQVLHANVDITDYSCLDFALKARIKTAVRRARSDSKLESR